MYYLWTALLLVALIAAWLSNLFSLPGNWLMVCLTALFAWATADELGQHVRWSTVAVMAGLALLGEVVELAAAAAGAARAGASKRSTALAIVGSVFGSIVGGLIGLPVPVAGTLVGVVLGGGIGALLGALAGEHWKGRTLETSWRVGQSAFWGRLVGTFSKATIGAIMVAVALAAAVF